MPARRIGKGLTFADVCDIGSAPEIFFITDHYRDYRTCWCDSA